MPNFRTQEQRNVRLAISLAILVVIAAGFMVLNEAPRKQLVDPDLFRVEDQEKIDGVLLKSARGKIELKFDGSRWRVNNAYDADRQLVKVLFATLDQAQPKRPVSANLQDSVSSLVMKEGVEVSLFMGNELVKKFWAGGNAGKTEAWFKQAEGKAYVMIIPGYRAYVSYVLELGEDAWRDKRVFNFNWRNFKALKATVPGDRVQDFEILFADKFFTISNLAKVDTTRLNDYLDAVSLLTADRIITSHMTPPYDSLIKTPCSFHIQVKDIADQNYSLQVWPPLKNDPNVLARWGEDDVVLFSRAKMIPIARKRSYFSSR